LLFLNDKDAGSSKDSLETLRDNKDEINFLTYLNKYDEKYNIGPNCVKGQEESDHVNSDVEEGGILIILFRKNLI
jgi:hypothetical protein